MCKDLIIWDLIIGKLHKINHEFIIIKIDMFGWVV